MSLFLQVSESERYQSRIRELELNTKVQEREGTGEELGRNYKRGRGGVAD